MPVDAWRRGGGRLRAARWAVAPLVAGIAMAGASVAHGAVVQGSATDPQDGALPGGRDIVAAQASYDDAAGTVIVKVTLRGEPTAGDGVIAAVLGSAVEGDGCAAPHVGIGGPTGDTALASQWFTASASGAATRERAGTTVTFTGTASQLASATHRCVTVGVGGGGTTHDVIGPFALAAPGPADPGPGQPGPTPGPTPAPPTRATVTVAVPASATLIRGRWQTVRVRVRNTGTAPARAARLTVAVPSGVQVTVPGATRRAPRARALGTLRPGATRTVAVRVRSTRALRASAKASFSVRATGRGTVRARAATALRNRVVRPVTPPRTTPGRGPLAGRYFWGWVSHTDRAWDNRGVYFSNDRWAHVGLPASGLPDCTARTEVTDGEGRPTGEGCRPYTYDASTGALRVGDLTGTYKNGKLELDEVALHPLHIPKAGQRYNVSLIHRGFSGICGFITGCTTWFESLALNDRGEFVRGSSSMSSIGDAGSGSPPFVGVGVYPPDEAGTYEVLSKGRIRFSYLDGTVKVETIGVEVDAAGRPAPNAEGILIADTNFYPGRD